MSTKLRELIDKLRVEKERDALKRLAESGEVKRGHFKIICKLKRKELVKKGLIIEQEQTEDNNI